MACPENRPLNNSKAPSHWTTAPGKWQQTRGKTTHHTTTKQKRIDREDRDPVSYRQTERNRNRQKSVQHAARVGSLKTVKRTLSLACLRKLAFQDQNGCGALARQRPSRSPSTTAKMPRNCSDVQACSTDACYRSNVCLVRIPQER